jgi:quinol monooxygenase YgiN
MADTDYVLVARWRARAGNADKIEAILRELVPAIRREPGCRAFTVHRGYNDKDEFLLYEIYASEQAYRDHQDTEHFKRLVLGQAVPLLDQRERNGYSVIADI